MELTSGPAAEVVSTADAKTWLRIDTSSDDTVIAAISVAARRRLEEHTGRRFITQTWKLWLDAAPEFRDEPWWDGVREGSIRDLSQRGDEIDLKLAPVASITSVKYYDRDNTEATFAAASYLFDGKSSPARVILNAGYSWPSSLRDRNAIAVEMVLGYGAAGSNVPEPIQIAIKSLIAYMYENRGESCTDGGIPGFIHSLVDPYVVKRVL